MDITQLVIHMVSGVIGGHASASLTREGSLGAVGNTIVGAIGGGIGGHLLSGFVGAGAAAATTGLDFATLLTGFLTGGISGGVTVLVLAFLNSKRAA
jgi:hypothetical protein